MMSLTRFMTQERAGRIPHVPHWDLSPKGPFRRPIAMLSGQPQLEQCQTPLITLACCPSANSFSFASLSLSLAFFAIALASGGGGATTGAGGSFSSSDEGNMVTDSIAVVGIGSLARARGRRISGGYSGALNSHFGFFSLFSDNVVCGTDCGGGNCSGMMAVPFSDATMLAIVTEAAAAAARLDVGALAAAARASVAGSSSGKPIAGVR